MLLCFNVYPGQDDYTMLSHAWTVGMRNWLYTYYFLRNKDPVTRQAETKFHGHVWCDCPKNRRNDWSVERASGKEWGTGGADVGHNCGEQRQYGCCTFGGYAELSASCPLHSHKPLPGAAATRCLFWLWLPRTIQPCLLPAVNCNLHICVFCTSTLKCTDNMSLSTFNVYICSTLNLWGLGFKNNLPCLVWCHYFHHNLTCVTVQLFFHLDILYEHNGPKITKKHKIQVGKS